MEPAQQRIFPHEVGAVKDQTRADRVDPRLSSRGIGEDVDRWDLMVLDDSAPGSELPAKIEFAQRAEAGQETVGDAY
jgi:hypothetical protein